MTAAIRQAVHPLLHGYSQASSGSSSPQDKNLVNLIAKQCGPGRAPIGLPWVLSHQKTPGALQYRGFKPGNRVGDLGQRQLFQQPQHGRIHIQTPQVFQRRRQHRNHEYSGQRFPADRRVVSPASSPLSKKHRWQSVWGSARRQDSTSR